MIKYKVSFGKIEKYQVVRETEKQLVYIRNNYFGKDREIREAKASTYHSWHDTWEDAKDHILVEQSNKVKSLRLRLEQENGRLGQIKGMKNPDDQVVT